MSTLGEQKSAPAPKTNATKIISRRATAVTQTHLKNRNGERNCRPTSAFYARFSILLLTVNAFRIAVLNTTGSRLPRPYEHPLTCRFRSYSADSAADSRPTTRLIYGSIAAMASQSHLSFAQRAANHPNQLTKRLFGIAERKKTNIVLSADLTTTADLLKIANGACFTNLPCFPRSRLLMVSRRSRTVHCCAQDTYRHCG